MRESCGEPTTTGKMKQFATLFTHGVRHGSHLRTAIHRAKQPDQILQIVDKFFEEQLEAVGA